MERIEKKQKTNNAKNKSIYKNAYHPQNINKINKRKKNNSKEKLQDKRNKIKSKISISVYNKKNDEHDHKSFVCAKPETNLKFVTRAIWSCVMIIIFITVISFGHLSLIVFVFLFQILAFKEIIKITPEPAKEQKLPLNKSLNGYFLFATLYYLDGQRCANIFQNNIYSNKLLKKIFLHHKFISYTLYIAGFVLFVGSLKKGFYKFQFAQLCITLMTLLLVVFQSHLIIDNILNGIIWIVLPSSLVVVNDIFAYLCGKIFGRTQLIEISPKKTVEGFVGAWFCTGISAMILSILLSKSDYFVCSATNFTTNIFNYPHCDRILIFNNQIYYLPQNIVNLFNNRLDHVTIKPIFFHLAAFATFASLIAPFGGFFASGIKRAFGLKDFGDTIPGHGGVTDRIDCQFLMGSFIYLYYQTFISPSNITIDSILNIALANLNEHQLIQLIKKLALYLNSIDVFPPENFKKIITLIQS